MKYIKGNLLDISKKISKIGLGTARFGTRVETETAFEMLDLFVEHGGTVLDTAHNYNEWAKDGRGKSEQCLGTWMQQRKNREEVVICTKGGVRRDASGERYFDLSYSGLTDEVKESLDCLQTDYIDIYLLHKDEKTRDVREIMDTMQEVCEIAKIREMGVANWSYDRVKAANEYAREKGYKEFRVLQTWWSLAEYTKEMWNDENTTHMTEEMYQYLTEHQMIGMAYTAQCKGFFQKAIKYGVDPLDDFLKQRIVTPRNLAKLDYIKRFCADNHVNPTGVVNSYITDNALEGIALVGCSAMMQLQEILEWSDYTLKSEVKEQLDRI